MINLNSQSFFKCNGEIWIGYCGTLGASYDLTVVFDTMKMLNSAVIKFVVMGDGPRKNEFIEYSNGLNVVFTGSLPYGDMCGLLAHCDIVVNPIMHNAAQSIINKHTDYAASGLPVLNTQESLEYCKLVENYNMGINCNNSDPKSLFDGAMMLTSNRRLRQEMGINARLCAEMKFDRRKTYQELKELIINE